MRHMMPGVMVARMWIENEEERKTVDNDINKK